MTIYCKNYFIFEDLLLIFFVYSLLKYIIFSIIIEIFWITSFFNKKNNFIKNKKKFKNFSENLLKLINKNNFKNLLFIFFFKYFNYKYFLKKKKNDFKKY